MPFAASLRTRVIQVADFTEGYVLAGMYLYQAMVVMDTIVLRADSSLALMESVREINFLIVYLLLGLMLLLRRTATEGPRELKEVFVPLAVTLFFLAYQYVPRWLPPVLNVPLASPPILNLCRLASLYVGVGGALIAIWGIISLGRSFGIFVAVRKVVLVGPYKYVRHPIYSGYVFIWLGILLSHLSLGIILLVTIHTVLMVWRAKLEERRLAEASPEYRAHLRETGFLFPRLDAHL